MLCLLVKPDMNIQSELSVIIFSIIIAMDINGFISLLNAGYLFYIEWKNF